MCEANQSQVTQVFLLGFGLHTFKALLFIAFLLTYVMVLSGNLLIIFLVTTIDHLKIPMFFFLKHLAIADVLLTTVVVPRMLNIIIIEQGRMSFAGCITQLYCFTICGSVQCFLIAAMSYDRFLAICLPLRYASLMNTHVCLQLVFGSWTICNLLIASEIIVVCQFNFCGLNHVDHFFCDFGPILELSTSDKFYFLMLDFVITLFMIPVPFAFIIITYICISFSILKISSFSGRRKAFSTCSSHLATVCTYFGTLITVYLVPIYYNTVNISKYMSFLYIVVTPLMNPIIYSLRNKEIKRALVKCIINIRTAS